MTAGDGSSAGVFFASPEAQIVPHVSMGSSTFVTGFFLITTAAAQVENIILYTECEKQQQQQNSAYASSEVLYCCTGCTRQRVGSRIALYYTVLNWVKR